MKIALKNEQKKTYINDHCFKEVPQNVLLCINSFTLLKLKKHFNGQCNFKAKPKVLSNLIAYFFLISFIAGDLFPLNLIHNHLKVSNVIHNDMTIENNPCHIAIYHNTSLKSQCEHKTHISKHQEVCNDCTGTNNRRFYFTLEYYQGLPIVMRKKTYSTSKFLPISLNTNQSYLGRAPPRV